MDLGNPGANSTQRGASCDPSEVCHASQEARISGRCLCGDIHFSINSKIGQILLCHCSQCRRSSGSPYVPYVALQRQAVMQSIHGDAKNVQWGTIELSNVAKRNFCKKCGSLICMDYHAPSTVWIPLGILDHTNDSDVVEWIDFRRDSQIFREDKVPWMEKLQSLPLRKRFGTYRADICGDVAFENLPPWKDDVIR